VTVLVRFKVRLGVADFMPHTKRRTYLKMTVDSV